MILPQIQVHWITFSKFLGSFLILCEMREVKVSLIKVFFRCKVIDNFDTLILFLLILFIFFTMWKITQILCWTSFVPNCFTLIPTSELSQSISYFESPFRIFFSLTTVLVLTPRQTQWFPFKCELRAEGNTQMSPILYCLWSSVLRSLPLVDKAPAFY